MSATTTEFVNEPLLELRRAEVRADATAALAALDAQLPLEVPMLIGTELVRGNVFASVDPGVPTRIVAHAHAATAAQSRASGRGRRAALLSEQGSCVARPICCATAA